MPGPIDRQLAATTVAYVVNPLILPAGFFLWLGIQLGWSWGDSLRAAGVAGGFLGLAPLVVASVMVLRGRAQSLEVRDRSLRLPVYAWVVAFGVAAVMYARAQPWPAAFIVAPLLAIFPVNSALLALINLKSKISVHAASIAATAALGLWFAVMLPASYSYPLAAVALTPIVMWSRVHTSAHTAIQVVWGAIFGVWVPVTELYILLAVGWLQLP